MDLDPAENNSPTEKTEENENLNTDNQMETEISEARVEKIYYIIRYNFPAADASALGDYIS